jgi:hypothetical protein
MQTAQQVRSTVYTLGVAAEYVARVVSEVAGNDVACTLGGQPATLKAIGEIAGATFQRQLHLK